MEQKKSEDKSKNKMEPMSAYRKDLQQQLVNKQRQEHCQYENTYSERKMQDGIMGTDAEEDQRELQYKHDETEKRRKEMGTSQWATEAWQENQKWMDFVEDQKIDEQRHLARDRSSAVADKREKKILQREEQAEKLGQILLKDAAKEQKELGDEEERQMERKKTARNKQYDIDLCEQIDGNTRRRKAEYDVEQKRVQDEIDYDAAWRPDVNEGRKNKHDEEPVEKPAGYNRNLEVEESQANEVLILYNDMEQKECEEKSEMESPSAYSINRQQQLVNKRRQEHCQFENTYCERKMQDGVMGTDAEEDQRDLQYKHDETEKRRTEMGISQRERVARKENEGDWGSSFVDERDRRIFQREEQARKLGEVEESQANEVLYNDMEQKECEEKPEMELPSAYSINRQQQLVNKRRQEHCQFENTYCERKMQDGVMGTDAEEDQRDLQYKHDETEKRRTEMGISQRERAARKENQKGMDAVENRKIEQQRHLAWDRGYAVVDERDRKIHQREEQAEKLGQILLADAAEKRERADGIQHQQEQEYFERNAQDDMAELRKEEVYQEDARRDREDVVRRHGRNTRRQTLEDAYYKEIAEQQMEIEDEKERQKELSKIARNKQYNIDLCKQIEDNARRRKAEADLEQKRAQEERDYDSAWRSDVIEERRKLAEEHVHKNLQTGEVDHDELPVEKPAEYKDDVEGDMESLAVSDRRHSFSKSNYQYS